MANNSLAPAFVRVNYTSEFSLHVMTIPSVPWIEPAPTAVGTARSGLFDLRGLNIDVIADTAIKDYINLLKPLFSPQTTFLDYTIFTQVDAQAAPLPRYTGGLTIVGTGAATSWRKAVQKTYSFRTENFGHSRVVLLDCNSDNTFEKKSGNQLSTAEVAMVNYVAAEASWISGQDNARPVAFTQLSVTLNEKLRRAYKMN
jgi:hypothetical protein